MCAAKTDLTAAARIRETAMRLFAERGAAVVTIREIASASGVSPSLVMHHYGSKDGLKAAVDRRATALVEAFFSEVADSEHGGVAAPSLAAAMADRLEQEPVLPAYLRRLLVDGGPPADSIFQAMFAATVSGLEALQAAGLVRPAIEDRVRAAFLLVNDLALVLLRDQIRGVLGADPLSKAGMPPWTAEVLDVYAHGVFVGGAAAPGRGAAAGERS
jgi:TetR/AcrR family transcriptional regulator, regulator of cefoperazone and chloramphenicol sensitivity